MRLFAQNCHSMLVFHSNFVWAFDWNIRLQRLSTRFKFKGTLLQMQIEVMPYKSSPFHLDSGRGLAIECDNVGKVIRKRNPQFLVVLNSCFTKKGCSTCAYRGWEICKACTKSVMAQNANFSVGWGSRVLNLRWSFWFTCFIVF